MSAALLFLLDYIYIVCTALEQRPANLKKKSGADGIAAPLLRKIKLS
jgi:hypothetical protein